jgi:hypothetical protein
MDKLVFQKIPAVDLGSNLFINCPTILQFDDDPLIEIVRLQNAGFSTSIPIYHQDGTYLARVVGSQIYATEEGKKAKVQLSHPQGKTVCKTENQILFEITRQDASALKTTAELYTPSGHFVKYSNAYPSIIDATGQALKIHGVTMLGNTISNFKIGIWAKSDGSLSIGCNP